MILLFVQCASNQLKNNDQQCNCGDLVLDEPYNHYFLEERTSPFTGTCIKLNKNGTLNLTKEFLEGKLHGDMIRYHPNGRKLSLIHFDNNFIDGKAFYFDVNGGDSIVQYYERGELIR